MTTLRGTRANLQPQVSELGSPASSELTKTEAEKFAIASPVEQTKSGRAIEEQVAKARAGHGGVEIGRNLYTARLGGLTTPLKPSAVDAEIRAALGHRKEEAYRIMDRVLEQAPAWTDGEASLLAIQTGDRIGTGLDMGRSTASLVMLAEVAGADGDTARAARYLEAATKNYAAADRVLRESDFFVHQKNFSSNPPSVARGEPGRSAPNEDNMARVNPRAYAMRAAAELYRATGAEKYLTDLEADFAAFVRDHHDRIGGGFFIHANVDSKAGDHKELLSGGETIKVPGGEVISRSNFPDAIVREDGTIGGLRRGIKGNDGTIYALSSILLPANETLATRQTQQLVKEQMDLILDKFHRVNGMLWENYSSDWKPISVGWQSQTKTPDRPAVVPPSLSASIQPADGVLIPGQRLEIRIPEPSGGRYNGQETWNASASSTLVKPDGSRLDLGSQYFARPEMNATGGTVGHQNDPISLSVPNDAPEGSRLEVGIEMRRPKGPQIQETLSFPVVATSHVAIGGHTAMAPQQIIEGARQLERQQAISKREADKYVDRAVDLFQEFATKSGAIDWSSGAVHNAIRVEEPRIESRWIQGWGDAAWQQAELIQTLLRFREEGRLDDIKGPDGKTGSDLLRLAEKHHGETNANPSNVLSGFGNEWLYHPSQLLQYHQQVVSRLPDEAIVRKSLAEGAKVYQDAIALLDGGAPQKLDASLKRLAELAKKGGVPLDNFRDPHTGQSFAMAVLVRGDAAAYSKALELGSNPTTDINPITGQTQAHFAAMIFDRGDGATGQILTAMEKRIGLLSLVELVNRRVGADRDPPLNLHTVAADAAFNRNNSAAEYIVGLHGRAAAQGLAVDVTSPTARGFVPAVLIRQRPGAFSSSVREFFENQPTAVRDRNGTEHASDAEMRRVEHSAWARSNSLPPDRALALIEAMEGSNFDATKALLGELGLGWNSKIGYLGQTPLYFNTMSPSPPDAKLDFQRRAFQAGASAIEVEEGLMHWHLAGRQGALSSPANFAGGSITGNSRLALDTLEHIRSNTAEYGAAYRDVLNEQGIINGRTLIADVLVAGNWPLALRLLGEDKSKGGGLGSDGSIRGYDRASLLELAEKVARDTGQTVPRELADRLRQEPR